MLMVVDRRERPPAGLGWGPWMNEPALYLLVEEASWFAGAWQVRDWQFGGRDETGRPLGPQTRIWLRLGLTDDAGETLYGRPASWWVEQTRRRTQFELIERLGLHGRQRTMEVAQ